MKYAILILLLAAARLAVAQPADTLVTQAEVLAHFDEARALGIDPLGKLYVVDAGKNVMHQLGPDGGLTYTPDEVSWLVGRIERLKPFPDVIAALGRLRDGGYGLAILSNGDRDMLEAAKPHIGFAFDHVISVQVSQHEPSNARLR